MKFSVLMSVYKNETVSHFKLAMESILNQTVLPDEIVLMRDGPVSPEMQEMIDEFVRDNSIISYYPLKDNKGLGNALRIGVTRARNEYIARMDTDDIALPNRFEKQTEFMECHPEISVCGGQIIEFIGDINKKAGKREVPLYHKEIEAFMKKRNAFNHMTVMFKKQDVINAGNYIEVHYIEDYYLWCRMLIGGYRFANLPDTLVYVRTDESMYRRRGGYKYFKSWKMIEKYKLNNHMISPGNFISTIAMRFVVQVLVPTKLRGYIIKNFSRNRVEERIEEQ